MFARRMLFGTLLLLLALTPPPAFPAALAAPPTPAFTVTQINLKLSLTDGPKQPQAIALGPDGNFWITETQTNSIARMTVGSVVTVTNEFTIPTPEANPMQIAPGPDGNMWFAMYGGGTPTGPGPGRLGRITPAGGITEYPLAAGHTDARTWSVVTGPDGNLWFTEYDKNAIGRMKPDGTNLPPITLPVTYTNPTDITVGADRAIWFTCWGGDAIGRIPVTATVSTDISLFGLPSGSAPIGIISGPDGNIWFAESGISSVARMNPFTKHIDHFPTPPPQTTGNKTGPLELAVGPDGNIWIVEYVPNKVASVTTTGIVTIKEYNLADFGVPAGAHPNTIVRGPDGRMYFTEEMADMVGAFSVTQRLFLPLIRH